MSDDLVKRVRDMCGDNGILAIRDIYDHDVAEAADRIEKLEAALCKDRATRHASDCNGRLAPRRPHPQSTGRRIILYAIALTCDGPPSTKGRLQWHSKSVSTSMTKLRM